MEYPQGLPQNDFRFVIFRQPPFYLFRFHFPWRCFLSMLLILDIICAADSFFNQISRPSFHFFIDLRNVISDNSKADHNDASNDQDQQDHRSKSLHSMSAEILHKGLDSQYNGHKEYQHSGHCHALHGDRRKRYDILNCVLDQRSGGPFGFSFRALLHIEFYRSLFKSHQEDSARKNTFLSGIDKIASTALRSKSLKSEALDISIFTAFEMIL